MHWFCNISSNKSTKDSSPQTGNHEHEKCLLPSDRESVLDVIEAKIRVNHNTRMLKAHGLFRGKKKKCSYITAIYEATKQQKSTWPSIQMEPFVYIISQSSCTFPNNREQERVSDKVGYCNSSTWRTSGCTRNMIWKVSINNQSKLGTARFVCTFVHKKCNDRWVPVGLNTRGWLYSDLLFS